MIRAAACVLLLHSPAFVIGCGAGEAASPTSAQSPHLNQADSDAEGDLCADAPTCHEMGRENLFGDGGAGVDSEKAMAAFEKGCSLGWGESCLMLGLVHSGAPELPYDGEVDERLAFGYFERGCAAEPPAPYACAVLGTMYATGDGAPTNHEKAAALFRRGCEAELAVSCFELGVLYQKGQGVATNKAKALDLYRRACEADNGKACNNLGYMYENGEGVKRDRHQAIRYYSRACAAGFEGPVCDDPRVQ